MSNGSLVAILGSRRAVNQRGRSACT